MDAVRVLFNGDADRHTKTHKDKLADAKANARAMKEAHKAELAAAKDRKEEERKEDAAIHKAERMFHPNSKRAQAEAREQAHKVAHQWGELCEHGVWKCRICFPHKTGK